MKSVDKYEKKIRQLEDQLSGFQTAVSELKVLNEIAVAAGRSVNLDQTLQLILNKTVSTINSEHGAILLVSESQEILNTIIKQDNKSRIKSSYHIGEHITGWVLLNKKSLIIKDLKKDDRFKTTEEERENIKSLICSPIWFEGKIIGVLQMTNKKSVKSRLDSFTDNDLTLLSIISVQAGQLIKNSELQQTTYEKQKEAEKLQELDRIKTNFFNNLSHEFRTPLTLILGPLEKIMAQTNYNEEQLKLIYKNANRLLKLINQLLDLSSIDAHGMKLNLDAADVITFIKGITASFQPLAEIKNIKIVFDSQLEELEATFDKDKLEKVLSNLLINAIKFTGNSNQSDKDAKITISIESAANENNDYKMFRIIIEDSGIGISTDKIKNIFNRFFTEKNNFVNEIPTGTGIGLSLVKELVELHHGSISVESVPDEGSKFKLEFPSEEIFYKNLGLNINSKKDSNINNIIEENDLSESKTILNDEKPLILIVEDNEDIRKFIKENIGISSRILESNNGKDAFKQAVKNIPDLVLSDVLMNEISGTELCEKLKTDERTSHIPVVLLTSQAATELKVKGIETGADDYITKPFSIAELTARVNNLITQRNNLRKKYKREIIFDNKDFPVNSVDEKFLNKVFQIIEEHISDCDFSVEKFADQIGLSRMQLHRKLHALTDQSANEVIRTYRLKRASRLLIKKAGNISEVGYEVGFNNPSYFASSFKNLFGCSPSEYLQNLNSIQET